MPRLLLPRLVCILTFASGISATAHAESRAIDVERSTITIFVYKSGVFSALADNHVIRAPIAHGSVSEDAPFHVEIAIRSSDLRVVDPDLPDRRRAEVQTRMAGSEVLDIAAFPEITFVSTTIAPIGPARWEVAGRLTIHGHTRQTVFSVTRVDRRYRGSVLVKQRDFGIEPISIAGGTVKVKDELRVQFDIEPAAETPAGWSQAASGRASLLPRHSMTKKGPDERTVQPR
jgi:YceI-like protein